MTVVMYMRFVKMQGAGNDYVYVDCFKQPAPEDPSALAIEISKPHTGVGADGLILIEPCPDADARMRIFNKDGSEGEMCGNGIRCVGKYLYDSGLARKKELRVMTGGGLKLLQMLISGRKAVAARVDMGQMRFAPEDIPVNAPDNVVDVTCLGHKLRFFCVNAGNPHAVTTDLFPEGEAFERLGAALEVHPVFPKRANISFVKVLSRTQIQARIWERGSGATQACGSGATACVTALSVQGLTENAASVSLPGGELFIEYDPVSQHAFMTGPAVKVFEGKWDL